MIEILLMATLTSLPITAGLYTLLSGPGPAGRQPRHRNRYTN